jgi:hypothetical protein
MVTIDINEYAEGAVLLTGLEDAIVGIAEEFGNGRRVIYSKNKILTILQERDGMSWSESEEYFDFNILGLYAGEQNPIFLDMSITPKQNDEGDYEYLLEE